MRVISFVSQKGGSGKTTLCFSIGVAAYEAGAQGLHARPRSPSVAARPGTPIARRRSRKSIRSSCRSWRRRSEVWRSFADYVFIDTPGKDDPANSKAITLSDFCIIPCRPTPGDMKAIRPTVANVDRVGKPTAFVLTQTPPKSFRVTEAKTALSMLGLVARPLSCSAAITRTRKERDSASPNTTRTVRPPRR